MSRIPGPRWLPAALVQLGILVAVLLPESSVPDGPDALSVVFHVAAYAALAFTLVLPGGLRRPAVVLGLVALSALATEGLQSLTATRTADPMDLLADVAGGAAGLLAARLSLARTGADAGRSPRR